MAVDTPARIAVIGAGPIGIEAALYARFLGYDVDLYERGEVCDSVRRWGHAKLFSTWTENVSPLGMAALRAQDEQWQPAADDALLTGREMLDRYWLPLAQSDLLIDGLHERTEVVAIGRPHFLKTDQPGSDARADDGFLILTRDANGNEQLATADVVIDCSGVFNHPRGAGQGGLPAAGEFACREQIEYGLVDFTEKGNADYAGHRVLVVGDHHLAALNVIGLAQLQPRPQVTWITRCEPLASATGPMTTVANDRVPERSRVLQAANDLIRDNSSGVTHHAATELISIRRLADSNALECELAGSQSAKIEVDRIIVNVGFQAQGSHVFQISHVAPRHEHYGTRPNLSNDLQVEISPITGGPMKLGAALASDLNTVDFDETPGGAANLVTGEPDFYILGAKSFGRDPRFLLSTGRSQIRALFAVIGDRAELNLYKSIRLG